LREINQGHVLLFLYLQTYCAVFASGDLPSPKAMLEVYRFILTGLSIEIFLIILGDS
jgi:hypothetical protein